MITSNEFKTDRVNYIFLKQTMRIYAHSFHARKTAQCCLHNL